MTIDPAAARANDSGWTKEALRAEKKAARKAARAAFWRSVRGGLAVAWDFFLRNQILWLAIAGVIAIGAWEWWNTSRGWVNLYPGLPAFVPYIGALGAIILYFHSFREMRENFRANNVPGGWTWLSVTMAAYAVCVVGVFIATATAAEKADRAAKESRVAYNRLVVERDKLKARVELNDPELLEMAVAADRTTLEALEQTAKATYGMADLTPGSGCPAPPKKFVMERLCAQANGGIDPLNGEVLAGIRKDIERGEKLVRDAAADAEALKALEQRVAGFHLVQGDETSEALGEMFKADGGTAMGWLLLFLSSAFLYGGGWLGDWVWERIEKLRIEARKAREAKVP